ncbi:Cytoplasmic dynein 2 light intermediate chain 1 [Globomyces sp. JEL0801]|nr:Cytoplasmic dynein 2 light intermediate chain 1 [Globomyces sp. JEL0801]
MATKSNDQLAEEQWLDGSQTNLDARYSPSTMKQRSQKDVWSLIKETRTGEKKANDSTGGVYLSDLLDIPINESNIHLSSLVIVLDLSKPDKILDILDHFLEKIRSRIKVILDKLESRGSKRPQALRSYAWKRFGTEHPDETLVKPLPVPILILGTNYDSLASMESERRKLLTKTLRYVAHSNGGSIVFNSIHDEALNTRTRQYLTHLAFRGSAPKTIIIDHNKPISVLAGQDTFSQIGLPPSEVNSDTIGRQNVVSYEVWRTNYNRYFPSTERTTSNNILMIRNKIVKRD